MKKIKTVSLVLVLVMSTFVFFACNPTSNGFLDVYENHESSKEFTSYEVAISSIPKGWELFASDETTSGNSIFKNSNSGYVSELDGFVVKKVLDGITYLNIIKCGTTDLMFQESQGITAIRVANGHIVLKNINGEMYVTDFDGKTVIPRGIVTGAENITIDNAIKVLDNELIAINPNYDKNATDNKSYTSIYRASTGKVAMRVRNAGASLSSLSGFDGKYVVSTGTVEDEIEVSRIFTIPNSGKVVNSDGGEYGSYEDNGEENYYNEITYMGGGKFLIHEDWTVEKEDDYTYFYNDEYVKVSRFIYDAERGARSLYESNVYFLNLVNHYYGAERNGFATKNILREGYYYASYCMIVDTEKKGHYDQLVLDSNFEIVYSLSGNFGASKDNIEEVDSVSYFDLALHFVDGIGLVPLPSAQLRVIDKNGAVLFTVDKTVTSAAYNNGVVIASTLNSVGNTIYAVYDLTGKEIVPFSKGFTEIKPFLGYYTIAKLNGKTVLLSKDGHVVEKMSDNKTVPLSDMAKTSKDTDIYKLGCYMFTEKRKSDLTGEDVTYFGVKKLSTDVANNVIIEANMLKGSILYAPLNSPDQVYVFAKLEGSDTFTVYKLTTDRK